MFVLISYNRPDKAKAVIEQIKSVGCTTKGLLFINGPTEGYEKIVLPDRWTIYKSRRNIGVCAAMNIAFSLYPEEPFYGLICDDEYVYTPGWDKILTEAAGKWNIAHGNEGWQSNRRIASYVTVGGELVRQCGWWALPGLWHWYHDDVQEVLAQALGLKKHCVQIKTEHKHYLAGKSACDATYKAGESKAINDKEVFMNWFQNEAGALVEKIAKAINREKHDDC